LNERLEPTWSNIVSDTHPPGFDASREGEALPDDARQPPTPGRPESNQTWWLLGFGFLAFWIVYLMFFAPGPRSPLEDARVDQPAEFHWDLRDLNGQAVSFSRFKGKTVFLNIWATWCGPCISEMPSIARLADNPRLRDDDIAFVCVSVDDAPGPVKQFVSGKNWSMTVLHAGANLPPVYQTEGIPATFIINPEGRIKLAEVGSSDWDAPEVVSLLEEIAGSTKRDAAGEPPPATKPAVPAG
jgi:thiol-disulfide isomerase/thioredoxin